MEMIVDTNLPSRELKRRMRTVGAPECVPESLPESVVWHHFIELHRRDEADAGSLFIGALRTLHSRRSIPGVNLPTEDVQPEEHRLAGDPFLGELWKAYKKCISANRTGPASLLLRDLEEQLKKLA